MGQCALGAPDGKSAAGGQVPLGGGRRGVGVLAPSDALAGDQGRFFADIQRTSSFELRAKWSGTTEPILPEFARAAALICVEPVFMASTRALVSLQAIEARFRRDPLLHRRMCDRRMFESTIAAAVMRAYDLPNEQAALQQRDVLHDCLICERIASLHAQLEWRQPYLTYALELIGTHEDADALAAKLSEVCDRAERCSSAKRHAFSIVIGAAYELLESSGTAAGASAAAVAEVADAPAAAPLGATLAAAAATVATPSGDLSTLAGARAHVHRVFADFLDEQKEAAVMASFTEPSRFYFDTIGDTFGRDHVTVHGVNWFLAVLHAALGVQAPFLVDYEDRHVLGIADVWLAFSEECWAIFSHPRNFGKQFGGIRELSERRNELLVAVVPSGQLPRGHRTTAPKLLGNMAVHAHSPKQLRLALARYCERFAHFFAHEPFARRCFEGLWSEQKPEHAGFRRACDTLYEAYRVEVGATQASLIEHAYADECYAELDLEAASAFLSWAHAPKWT
ncbi:hypothetical protein T492DRAFT_881138 [Pavlovales sp. CCMP2436]|nr:hypothetical protein T492DRAFT_881138 [Pavlovales sp. CCMP2436]